MVLRLEQGVEVPERGLDEVPIDLRESHAQEDPTNPLDVRPEDVPLPRPDQGRERLRVVAPEVDLPPSPGPEELRRRLGHVFLQGQAGREDPLPRGRQRDLAPYGLPFLDELPPRLQVPQDARVDRVLRQLALREPSEQQLVRSFRSRGLSPFGGHRDDAALRGLRHVRPTFAPQPSEGDGEFAVVESARGLELRDGHFAMGLDQRAEGLAFRERLTARGRARESKGMDDALLHRDQAFRLEPRSGVHHLDEFAELPRGLQFFGGRLLELAERLKDLLFKVTQLVRGARHPERDGPFRYMILSQSSGHFSPVGAEDSQG